jgi:hypothetical protein
MPTDLTFGQWVGRWLLRVVAGIVVLATVVYLGDWAVWRVRVATGHGTSKVMVSRVVVAKLKGNKEEYYPDGTSEVECSRSLFPQTEAGACWWVERHPVIFDR